VFEIAIDTGGTFTDGVLIDEQGKISVAKVPTDLVDPEKSLIGCIAILAQERNLTHQELLGATSTIVIGSTIATNCVVSKTGAKCCMICTRGFKDMLELSSRIPKDDPYDLRVPPPQYLVPRFLRFEVEERIQFDGKILTPINEEDVHRAVTKAKAQKIQVPIVCFLHSYMNPEHEEKAGELIKADYPEVVLSSHVLRRRMEGYRFHTAVLAGYVKPAVANFVGKLERNLERYDFKGTMLFITCAGGVATPGVCIDNPALMIGSGPAAGPLFANLLGDLSGFRNIASMDIGGTTIDLCILPERKMSITTEMIVAGHRNAMESVDVTSIGVGGGAIAGVDERGILCVGPESAGADPGPACYGKGGQRPTLTDADVVLGYIAVDFFLGGTMSLSEDLARKAIDAHVARPLGIDILQAAHAIKALAEENMAREAFLKFVHGGYDPREFVLVVGGGAGPVHAAAVAEKLGMERLYIPKHAAVFCPFGILLADYKYILSRFYYRSGNEINVEEMRSLYLAMEGEGIDILKRQGRSESEARIVRGAAMRYFGQLHNIDVFLPDAPVSAPFTEETLRVLTDRFHERHEDLYGRSDPSMPVTVETVKLHAVAKRRSFEITKEPFSSEDSREALKRKRKVYFKEAGKYIETPCYDSERLKHGNQIIGPAIIEETKTTVVIPRDYRLYVDPYGNYLMRRDSIERGKQKD
jgi:N-methylhydantoinase A